MPERKNKMTVILWVAAVAAGVVRVMLAFAKDAIVVQIGIRSYRSITTVSAALLGVFTACACISTLLGIFRSRKDRKKEAEKSEKEAERAFELEREKRKLESPLSVSDRMDPKRIRDKLEAEAEKQAPDIRKAILTIATQMYRMDELQEKHAGLLKENGADALGDTVDVLDEVEQYICRNVRKVLNYLSVFDSGEKDVLMDRLKECWFANEEQLKKTQDFLLALTEFLNRQGDSRNTDSIDIYKETILNAIR